MPCLVCLQAAMCIGSVAFMNFSLQFNSVGFYQGRLFSLSRSMRLMPQPVQPRTMIASLNNGAHSVSFVSSLPCFCFALFSVTKLLCIPCMVVIDSLVYRKHYSLRLKVTLAIVLLGVGIATVTDLGVTPMGCTVGALAVLFTTQFQIWQQQKQKQHGLDPMQINHSQSPPAALLCGLLAVLFECGGADPKSNVLLHEFSQWEVTLIGISCLLALSVNLCTYGLIGKTGQRKNNAKWDSSGELFFRESSNANVAWLECLLTPLPMFLFVLACGSCVACRSRDVPSGRSRENVFDPHRWIRVVPRCAVDEERCGNRPRPCGCHHLRRSENESGPDSSWC
jgi:hypothetical protein